MMIKPEPVVSKATADEIKRLLIRTVNEEQVKLQELKVWNWRKTGTAQIARGGVYLKNIYLHFWI